MVAADLIWEEAVVEAGLLDIPEDQAEDAKFGRDPASKQEQGKGGRRNDALEGTPTKANIGNLKTLEGTRDMISRMSHTCEWTGGSQSWLWQWPVVHQNVILRGSFSWSRKIIGLEKSHRYYRETRRSGKVIKKLSSVRDRGHIEQSSPWYRFSNIRMVYDGHKSGLNDVHWAP
jgi:hypothetical protein